MCRENLIFYPHENQIKKKTPSLFFEFNIASEPLKCPYSVEGFQNTSFHCVIEDREDVGSLAERYNSAIL
jgi:hypothetical protein